MVEQVRAFLNQDWKALSTSFDDFSDHKQAELKRAMKECAADTQFSLAKPYETDNDNFKYFALCLRNNIFTNPSLNGSKAIRQNVLGYQY